MISLTIPTTITPATRRPTVRPRLGAWLAVLAVSLGGATAARAQAASGHAGHGATQAAAGHAHQAPHGGQVVQAGARHVEFKADSTGLVQVWLLGDKQQPLAPPPGATVTMRRGDSEVTLPLETDGAAQRLTARFDPRAFPTFQAVVSIPVDGTVRTARFDYPAHH